jgi:hypothetical protein
MGKESGTPWTLICPEAKVTSFNEGVAKNGDGYFVFSIKCSYNNMVIKCTVFDNVDESERKKPNNLRKHSALYNRARSIQKGAYYIVYGYLDNILKSDGSVEPVLKVTDFQYCHDELKQSSYGTWNKSNNSSTNNSQKPITFQSGFGR